MAAALDHTAAVRGVPLRFQPSAGGASAAREVTAPAWAKYVVGTPDGSAGSMAGAGTQTDASTMTGNYVPVADGGAYTLALDDDELVVNGGRQSFYVATVSTSAYFCVQYL